MCGVSLNKLRTHTAEVQTHRQGLQNQCRRSEEALEHMPWKYEHIGKVVKIDVKGLRRRWSSSWSNSASEHARDLILVSTRSLDLNELRTHGVEVRTHQQGRQNRR